MKKIAAMLASCLLPASMLLAPQAAADACPDIEVVSARGTAEWVGPGYFGGLFINSLRAKLPGRQVDVYAVNYPASFDFAASGAAGASDAAAHVEQRAATCPNTKIVLTGMSQGAAVITSIVAPAGLNISGATALGMPDSVADHVSAVAVFGNPLRKWPGSPITANSPLYSSKALDLCANNDIFCSWGWSFFAHFTYGSNGMVDQAAAFAAARL